MSELIDMKCDEKKRNKGKENMIATPMESPYPYSLRLMLDGETLEKLGIKSLPKVGAKLQIQAVGAVCGVSSNEYEGESRRNVDIQIQRLSIGKGSASVEDAIEAGIEDADED